MIIVIAIKYVYKYPYNCQRNLNNPIHDKYSLIKDTEYNYCETFNQYFTNSCSSNPFYLGMNMRFY